MKKVKEYLRSPETIVSNWVMLVAIAVIAVLCLTGVFSKYHINLLAMIGINYVLAAGLNLLFGHTGQISIGQAAFYAIGAYGCAILEMRVGLPFFVAWPAAIVLTCFVTWVIGARILKLRGVYLSMATISFAMIIYALAQNWIELTNGQDGFMVRVQPILGEFWTKNFYLVILGCVVLAYTISNNIERSRIGRAIASVNGNEDAATSLGIPHSKYKVLMFMVGGAFAAVAGILYTHMNSVLTPGLFDTSQSQFILILCVVGGIGNNLGVLLAAIVITLLPEFLYGFADYNILIYGILVVVIQMFFPRGLAGLIQDIVGAIRKRFHKKTAEKEAN